MSEPVPGPSGAPAAEDRATWGRGHALVPMVATIAGIYVCYRLTAPFLPALAWALMLAVLVAPLQRWTEARLKRPGLAATLCVVVTALIVVGPALLVAARLIEEAANGALALKAAFESGTWRQAIEGHPVIAPVARLIERQLDLPGTAGNLASWLTNTSASLVRGSVVELIGVLVTFYLLFYFLRDRSAALAALRDLSPLSEPEMDRLFSRVVDIVHATIYGTVAVAAVQGVLSGLMFWWLDLPSPLLWGVVMGLLAVVPVFGAFVVWIPTAIFLALEGNWTKALILTAWGAVVVGGIDNLLYPMLVGNRMKLHTVPAFVAVVGGLIVFGPSGLILGPLAITITASLLEIWRARSPNRGSVGAYWI